MGYTNFAGIKLQYVTPATTRDVLDWRIWLPSLLIEDYIEQQLVWCARFVPEYSPDDLTLLAAGHAVEHHDGDLKFVGLAIQELGDTICASAELPSFVGADLSRLLDLHNKIDPEWKPTEEACSCPRCRRPDEIKINPEGITCIYDGINELALIAGQCALGLDAGTVDEPYYLTQLRHVAKRASARLLRFDRYQREQHDKYNKQRAELLGAPTHKVH